MSVRVQMRVSLLHPYSFPPPSPHLRHTDSQTTVEFVWKNQWCVTLLVLEPTADACSWALPCCTTATKITTTQHIILSIIAVIIGCPNLESETWKNGEDSNEFSQLLLLVMRLWNSGAGLALCLAIGVVWVLVEKEAVNFVSRPQGVDFQHAHDYMNSDAQWRKHRAVALAKNHSLPSTVVRAHPAPLEETIAAARELVHSGTIQDKRIAQLIHQLQVNLVVSALV